jgi:hypothetical protein
VAKARTVKGISCNASVADNARRIIGTRLDEMLTFSQYVEDPRNVTEIHDLRIAAKRLRYSMELFRFAFPAAMSGLIDEVKTIQEHIGEMHDADVMIERAMEMLASEARNRSAKLLEIATSIERGSVAQRQQRIRSAMASKTAPREEIGLLTLIAHRADDRDAAYRRFVDAWRGMGESDFAGRLGSCIGAGRAGKIARNAADEALVAG